MCINRDTKPATCCCGCSLMCGIITYTVFQCLSIISNIAVGFWTGMALELIFLAPNLWVIFSQDSAVARKVAYIFQWITFGLGILFVLVWAIILLTGFSWVIDQACGIVGDTEIYNWDTGAYEPLNSGGSCAARIKGLAWAGLLITAAALLPLQYLFVRIFGTFHEEKSESDVNDGGYEAVNN